MKRLTTLILAVLAAACGVGTGAGPTTDSADEFREASPSRQGLELRVGSGAKKQGLGGGPISELYKTTATVTSTINSGVKGMLDQVEQIISSPPAAVDQTHAVWGPITDPLSPAVMRFVVERNPSGMRYVLQGKPKQAADDAFVALLAGEHHPDASGAVTGQFLVNRDAVRSLNGDPKEQGGIAVQFGRSAQGDVAIGVNMHAVASPGAAPQPTDAAYRYTQAAGGDSAFEFVTGGDLNGNGTLEQAAIRARWHLNGAGQAEAAATGGDLQQNVAHVVECWADSFELTFRADNSGMAPAMGDPATCSFTSQPPPPAPAGTR